MLIRLFRLKQISFPYGSLRRDSSRKISTIGIKHNTTIRPFGVKYPEIFVIPKRNQYNINGSVFRRPPDERFWSHRTSVILASIMVGTIFISIQGLLVGLIKFIRSMDKPEEPEPEPEPEPVAEG